jgi:hypothetical protein
MDNTLSQIAYLGKQQRRMLLNFRDHFSETLSSLPPLPPPVPPPAFSTTGTEIEDLHLLLDAMRINQIEKFEGPNSNMNGNVLASLKLASPRIAAIRYQQTLPTGKYIYFHFNLVILFILLLNIFIYFILFLYLYKLIGSFNVDFPTIKEDVAVYISFLSNPESSSMYSWYDSHSFVYLILTSSPYLLSLFSLSLSLSPLFFFLPLQFLKIR